MRFVKTEKGDFVGREPTVASAEAALPWVCAYLAIETDGHHDGHGGEAVLMNGEKVGSTSSMAYGYTAEKIMAFAYITPEAAAPGQALEVVIANSPRAAMVLGEAAYDPMSERPRERA